jgi:hypothetical protein
MNKSRIMLIVFFIAVIPHGRLYTQWVESNGLADAHVTCVEVSGDTLFMGTSSNGLYRSLDLGRTWSDISPESTRGIMELAVSGAHLFASGDRIYHSTDGGLHWETSLSKTATVLYAGDGMLLAGISGGDYYRTTDNGAQWTKVFSHSGSSYWGNLCAGPIGSGLIFAAHSSAGVLASSDNGATWFSANSNLPALYSGALTVQGEYVYAAFDGKVDGVWRSRDYGKTWEPTRTDREFGVRALAVSNGMLLAGTDGSYGGPYRSTDEGATWTEIRTGFNSRPYISSFKVSGKYIFAGTLQGYMQTTDEGDHWIEMRPAPAGATITAFATDGKTFYAGSLDGRIFSSNNDGLGWSLERNVSSSSRVTALRIVDSTLIVGTQAGLVRSSDIVDPWVEANNGLANTAVSSLAESNGILFAGTAGGIFSSSDKGTSWRAANAGLTDNNVTSFAVDSAKVFTGTNGGGVFVSTDTGVTWNPSSNGLTDMRIRALTLSAGNLFAGSGEGVFLSTNGGALWSAVNNGLPKVPVSILASSDGKEKIIFAGTEGAGIYRSSDNGTSWWPDLTAFNVQAIAVTKAGLFAGPEGKGVWKRNFLEYQVEVERLSTGSSSNCILRQNYPNPFNPSTAIEFSIPHSGFVSLKVFDVLGKAVGSLVAEELQPGNYRIRWDASGFPAGLYFYRLEAGSFSETRKLMLIR